ncbi:19567_t:CDS:2 [Racocetra fulgida]|uniref:19567_t:CDS:1 n=1 Tax=Racocetra fulgida TaxID=60492 RepID=A0A9N9CQM7_9GLOM|nr:19567_t:CDS:2 [Racocetra fulgida]
MSRRIRGDRIAVWVRDKDNVGVINGIGLKQELENEERARLEELAKSAKRQSMTLDDSKTDTTVTTPDTVDPNKECIT